MAPAWPGPIVVHPGLALCQPFFFCDEPVLASSGLGAAAMKNVWAPPCQGMEDASDVVSPTMLAALAWPYPVWTGTLYTWQCGQGCGGLQAVIAGSGIDMPIAVDTRRAGF